MTSPARPIVVRCPRCHHAYESWWRASINLSLTPMTEAELRAANRACCPRCWWIVDLDALVVEWEPDNDEEEPS